MSFTPRRSTINQTWQMGIEATPGVAVAANRRIDCFQFKKGAKGNFKSTAGTGRKYASVQQLNAEWVEGSYSGSLDYNGLIYPLAGAYGVATPTAHGSSILAKDWVFDAILSGSRQPQTYSAEGGESTTRAEKFAYMLINKFGYKFDRNQNASVDGTFLGQSITDGITMTSSPTVIPLKPMVGQQFNIYIDPTYSALGTTLIASEALSFDFTFDSIYAPAWYINRANPSFSAHVDTDPNAAINFMVEADSVGMAYLTNMRTGQTIYIRVQALGDVIDNTQQIALGTPSAGNFTLTYKGQTTGNITYNAASSAVQTALQGLSTIGAGNATVSGSAGGPYTVTFASALATDTTALTGNGAGLTGGTFLITQTQVYHTFQHDMAVKLGQPSEWQDSNGVYAIQWSGACFEDAAWGHANQITITNLLTTL